jgi:hypothetical protein
MQLPPPVPLVLRAVQRIVDEVEQQQVEHEAHQRDIGHARPQAVDRPGRQAPDAQLADQQVPQRIDR